VSASALADAVERAMDDAGFASAHVAGSSLGGHLALVLASRCRARTVVALAPAGGWAQDDDSPARLLDLQAEMVAQARAVAPHAEASLRSDDGRRRATELITVRYRHIPVELLAHALLAVARCDGAPALIDNARRTGWPIHAEKITCPVRIVWGTADRLLPWPAAAERFRRDWLPHADWVELEDVGHAPQLDVPLETAELILGLTGG
jgi:pimeloyl-ACP methyl ester carboxylesterase